jgi:hypothetical protein
LNQHLARLFNSLTAGNKRWWQGKGRNPPSKPMEGHMNATARSAKFLGWLGAVGAGLAALAAAMPATKVRTAIEIDAPPERVFAVLADFAAYPDWNPYHVAVEGKPEVGAPLTVSIRRPDGKAVTVRPHLLRLEPNRELTWGGGIAGIFRGEHVLKLESLPGHRTKLIHDEDFTGIAVVLANLPTEVLTAGYRLMNEALKRRVEEAL